MTCPQCGASNAAGSRFCRICGAALGGSGSEVPEPAHRHPTGAVLLAAAGVTALIFLIIVGAGATLAIRAYSHRGPAQAGGIRPASAPPIPTSPLPLPPAAPPTSPQTPAPQASAPQAPPAAAPAPGPSAPSPGEAAVPMAEYRSPSGQWRITYPQAWHVKDDPDGAAVFYLDDPDEGTSYSVIPFATTPGEVGPQDLLEQLAAATRREYPDLQVTVRGTRDVGQAALLEGVAQWTGARRQPMRGSVVLYVFPMKGSGYTAYSFFGGQAPAVAFDAMQPIFTQMTGSFSR